MGPGGPPGLQNRVVRRKSDGGFGLPPFSANYRGYVFVLGEERTASTVQQHNDDERLSGPAGHSPGGGMSRHQKSLSSSGFSMQGTAFSVGFMSWSRAAPGKRETKKTCDDSS